MLSAMSGSKQTLFLMEESWSSASNWCLRNSCFLPFSSKGFGIWLMLFYMLITLFRWRLQLRTFVIYKFHIWKRGLCTFSVRTNHTYADLWNDHKIKYRTDFILATFFTQFVADYIISNKIKIIVVSDFWTSVFLSWSLAYKNAFKTAVNPVNDFLISEGGVKKI